MDLKIRTKKKRLTKWLILIPILISLLVVFLHMEREKPSILSDNFSGSINTSEELLISFQDNKRGLKKIWISLLKDGKKHVLYEKSYPHAIFIGRKAVHEDLISLKIEPKRFGITDGKAILQIVALDNSWSNWWKGNKTQIEREVIVDTKPPEITILSRNHSIIQGGACLVVYKVSEPCSESGVYAGENFFPGYSGYFEDSDILITLFALNYSQGHGTNVYIRAKDFTGNDSKLALPCYIREKTFNKDIINISDSFLKYTMPKFKVDTLDNSKEPLLAKFLEINSNLRKANFKNIEKIVTDTAKTFYWKGSFLRLPKSACRANFGDMREYKYRGETIDFQTHLGIDLASTARSRVPASNKGKVVFNSMLGIYGKTVIIDHGFGLFSMYAHLSSHKVKSGQIVAKGDIIGNTGITGLTGGDHLHFSILINNTFVNPREWWDKRWVMNNITSKLEKIESIIKNGSK